MLINNEKLIFNKIFDEDCNQDEIYENVGKKAFEDFLEGFDTTILTYGNVSTGKTYSMIGSDDVRKYFFEHTENNSQIPYSLENKMGIIPRICIDIIKQINDLKMFGNICILKISYIENYLNTINCLVSGKKNIFNGWGRDDVKYKEDSEPKKVECKNISQILNILSKGQKFMKVKNSGENGDSSRSHTFLIMDLEVTYIDGKKTHQKMLLADLAGSFRV